MGAAKSHHEASRIVEDSPFPLTDTDRWVLSQTDEEFHLHDWDGLKEIIGKYGAEDKQVSDPRGSRTIS
jgi:hypothetical protein